MSRTLHSALVSILWLFLSNALAIAQPAMLQVTGTVTDAETGEPIDTFWVVPGCGDEVRKTFSYDEATEHQNGEYLYQHYPGSSGDMLRIEADGYLPAISPALDSENDAVFDAKLRRAENIRGTVVGPDGKPAHDADVMLISADTGVHLENQRPGEHIGSQIATTDEEGRFSLRPIEGRFDVLVLHDLGRARVTSTDLASGRPVRLKQWARVEGVMMIGAEPAKRQQVMLSYAGARDDWATRESWDYRAKTDEHGRFAFDRVHVGDLRVGRVVHVPAGGTMGMAGVNNSQVITTEAGKTTVVRVGGVGRAVVGRIVLPPDMPQDFVVDQPTLLPPPQRLRAATQLGQPGPEPGTWLRSRRDELAQYSYVVPITADGSFRIDDVLPGEYRLSVSYREPAPRPSRENPWPRGRVIGSVDVPVTVPEIPDGAERSDESVDLGALALEKE